MRVMILLKAGTVGCMMKLWIKNAHAVKSSLFQLTFCIEKSTAPGNVFISTDQPTHGIGVLRDCTYLLKLSSKRAKHHGIKACWGSARILGKGMVSVTMVYTVGSKIILVGQRSVNTVGRRVQGCSNGLTRAVSINESWMTGKDYVLSAICGTITRSLALENHFTSSGI